MPLTCLVVDDRDEFLVSASDLLSSQGVNVVGVATSMDAAVKLAEGLRPDVALVDVELGDEDGIALARTLVSGRSVGHVVLISARDREELVELLGDSGAAGFVRKDTLDARIILDLIREQSTGTEPPRAS